MKYREIHLMKCITIQMGSINSIYNIEYTDSTSLPIISDSNNSIDFRKIDFKFGNICSFHRN